MSNGSRHFGDSQPPDESPRVRYRKIGPSGEPIDPPPPPPPPSPPPPRRPMTHEQQLTAEHLRLLAIFHYVAGGLALGIAAFTGAIAYFHFGTMLSLADADRPAEVDALFRPIRTFTLMIYIVMVGLYIAVAVMEFIAARSMKQFRWYSFCFVMAVVNCLGGPVLMALGIFTIIVLLRPEAKQLFGVEPTAARAATAPRDLADHAASPAG